jgi:hypothetical protein
MSRAVWVNRTSRAIAGVLALAALVSAGGCQRIRPYLPDNPFISPEVPGRIRKIAVLPFAYRDETGVVPCTMCPNPVVMAPTSEGDALLVTAFFYEALTRHPRFQIVQPETVSRYMADTMEETTERLEVMENVDAVLVGVLLELRPRLGSPQDPEEPGGAAIYLALIDARTKAQLWNRVFDRTQRPQNVIDRGYEVVVGGQNPHWLSAQGIAQDAALELTKTMARTVR